MWKFFERLGLVRAKHGPEPKGIDSVLRALDEGEEERPQPTLVCRECGLKYTNTGTFLKGSRCPKCHPAG
jgi:predicted Zn-ribbon and HTH transcriptional regulator